MAVIRDWVVRDATPEDADAMLAVAQSLPRWFNPRGLEEIERDLPHHAGFVAVRGDRVVGLATWTPVGREAAELSWIAVDEACHRSGIGSALLEAVVLAARASGSRALEVSTVADSVDYAPYAATRRFYRACGFRDWRVDPLHFGEGDDRYDRLVLRLDLRGEG